MPFYGDLRTVSLTDLLRWASSAEKTGVLEVERNAISRRIEFRKGHVGSCSSNDPSSRLGQFLMSRGRIDETQLHHTLTLHEATGKRLGLLLVELKILSRSELANEVAVKAQETIYGLFDWDDAFFRFDEGATLDPDQIEVSLPVEQLIAEGQTRTEQLRHIRRIFASSGVVLARTGREEFGEAFNRPLSQRILEAVDGQRTIAEVLLHARASEFPVLQFLYQLYERGLLEIRETRPASPEIRTLLDVASAAVRREMTTGALASDCGLAPGDATDLGLDAVIEVATRHMREYEYEAAVKLLRQSCREHTTTYARQLLLKAETAWVETIKQDESFTAKVPILLRDRHELLSQDPPPAESFLLTLIDGTTDVRCILWLAPMREVDVVIALQNMVDKQMIELADRPSTDSLVTVEDLDFEGQVTI